MYWCSTKTGSEHSISLVICYQHTFSFFIFQGKEWKLLKCRYIPRNRYKTPSAECNGSMLYKKTTPKPVLKRLEDETPFPRNFELQLE